MQIKNILLSVILLFSLFSFSKGQELTTDSILNQFVKKWVGRPYKFGGKTEKGIDCSQFSKRLYKDVYNIELGNVCWRQWNQTKRIKRDSLQTGDIIFFNSRVSPSGWHCGVYLSDNKFVHAANVREGVKISSLLEPKYSRIYKGAGRILKKEVDD